MCNNYYSSSTMLEAMRNEERDQTKCPVGGNQSVCREMNRYDQVNQQCNASPSCRVHTAVLPGVKQPLMPGRIPFSTSFLWNHTLEPTYSCDHWNPIHPSKPGANRLLCDAFVPPQRGSWHFFPHVLSAIGWNTYFLYLTALQKKLSWLIFKYLSPDSPHFFVFPRGIFTIKGNSASWVPTTSHKNE